MELLFVYQDSSLFPLLPPCHLTLYSMQIVYHPICTSFGQFHHTCNIHHHMYHPIFLHALTFLFAMMPSANLSIPLYDGPYQIIHRHEKHFLLHIQGKQSSVTLDRLKPAYLDSAPVNTTPTTLKDSPISDTPQSKILPRATRSGRRVHFPYRYGTA